MKQQRKIFWVKAVHSLFFFLVTACILFVLYSGVFDSVGRWTVIAIVVVIAEGAALALNRGRCPLTTMAENMGAEDGSVTGIFLPRWLADRAFVIWGLAFIVACIVALVRYVVE